MISNIGSESNIHANNLFIFIFPSFCLFYILFKLNSKLQPQTKTISNNDVTVIFCKVGKIATLDVAMIGSAIPAGWTKILDIPNGYIPKIAGHSSGIDVDGNHAIMNCDAGGISIYTDNTFTANYLYINLVYFL